MIVKQLRRKFPGSWSCALLLQNDKDTIKRSKMPRTSVKGTIPADNGKPRSADEEERAHNEHTDPYRDNDAACTRTIRTHGSKFNSRKCYGVKRMERSSVEYSETGKFSAWRMNEGRLSLRSLGDRTKHLYTTCSSLLIG